MLWITFQDRWFVGRWLLKTVFYFFFYFYLNLHFFCLWWICRPHSEKHKHASFSLQLVHNLLRTHWYARHCSAPTSYSLHWHSKMKWGENDLISVCAYVSGTWVTFCTVVLVQCYSALFIQASSQEKSPKGILYCKAKTQQVSSFTFELSCPAY